MNALKKAIKFETFKINDSKRGCLIFIALFIVFIVLLTVNYFCFMPTSQPLGLTREEIIAKYVSELAEYQELLITYGDSMSLKERNICQDNCKRLEFFVNNNCTEYDYLNAELLSEKLKGSEASGFMFYFFTVSTFGVWAIAIGFAAYLFVYEHQIGQYKNLVAGQVSRSKLFFGKLIVLFVCLSIIFAVLFLYALIFGLMNPSTEMLVLFNRSYVAISAIAAFIAHSVAIYVLMLLLAAFTIFIGNVFKNIAVAMVSSAAVYGLALMMSFAYTNVVYSNPAFQQQNFIKYVPIISLQLHVGGFDMAFIIALFAHLSVATALYFSAHSYFKGQDL